jgi:two-component system LytT family response regulator
MPEMDGLQLHLFAQRKIPATIALSSNQGLNFIKLEDIVYLEGDDCYMHVDGWDGGHYCDSAEVRPREDPRRNNVCRFR